MYLKTLPDLLEHSCSRAADSIAVISGETHQTYSELRDSATQIAGWLQAAGMQRRERVGIMLRKSTSELAATLGTAMLGGVFVNLNSQWTAEQVAYIQQDCSIRLLICDRRAARQLREHISAFTRVLVVDEDGWEDSELDKSALPARVLSEDLAALLYTSGSTGKPKGVMITHRNLVDGAMSVSSYLGILPSDRLLGLLPLSFDYGLNQFTSCLLTGATLVLQPVAMASAILDTIQKNDVTGMAAVPPTWIQVCQLLHESPRKLNSLRFITNSGGKIPDRYLQQLPQLLPGVEIVLMYGLTEAFRSTYLPPELFASKTGSMGRAIPNVETFVVADDGERLCAPGEKGELVHRGALISRGYWGNPAATAERIRSCPALYDQLGDEQVVFSGDIVLEDEDGFLWFVERKDTMIKCSGFRISPTEIEEVLHAHSSVRDAIAFGTPNEDLGQQVEVAVRVDTDSNSDELHQYCRSSMPNYMVPQEIHFFTEDFPRTASGKIDRPLVRELCVNSQ